MSRRSSKLSVFRHARQSRSSLPGYGAPRKDITAASSTRSWTDRPRSGIEQAELAARPGKDIGSNGLEVAIDDTTESGFHDTGAVYDLVAPEENAMKPAGEWNRLVVICEGARVEVELNGRVVTRANLDEFVEPNKRPDGSPHKFDVAYRDHPRKGYVGLQDHGADVWFRNIKVKASGLEGHAR